MYLCLFQALETHLQEFGINDLISVNIYTIEARILLKPFKITIHYFVSDTV